MREHHVTRLIAIAIIGFAPVANAQPDAESLYAEGQAAYDRADYAAAIAEWQASYDLSKEAGLLFDVAQAQRHAGDCAGAIATYAKFLATDPDPASDQHRIAETFARDLPATCAAIRAPDRALDLHSDPQPPSGDRLHVADSPSEPQEHTEHPGRALRLVGLGTGGAGIALLATGIALGHHGHVLGDDVTAACATSCSWGAQRITDAAGHHDVATGYAIDASGAAVIATGTVLYILGLHAHNIAIEPRLHEGGAIVSWSGSW